MMSLSDFQYHMNKTDFQRSNMFSVVFTSAPGSNSQRSETILTKIDSFGNVLAGDVGGLLGSAISTGTSYVSSAVDNALSGLNKEILGAMNNRVVETIAGSFSTTDGLMDLSNADFKFIGLMGFAVQLPEVRINHEMDRSHSAPGIKLMARDLDPLTISFRMDSEGKTYKTMLEWNYSIEDPVTGLRALPQDVSADVQIILFDRNMKPKTIYAFDEIMPTSVGSPELSYDSDNQISTFNVTFAYRSMKVVDVPQEKAEGFLADVVGTVINKVSF